MGKTMPTKPNRNEHMVQVPVEPGEDKSIALAKAVIHPGLAAAGTIIEFSPLHARTDLMSVTQALQMRAEEATGDDALKRAQEMLVVQAQSLDTIFNTLAQLGGRNVTAGHRQAGETYLRMALKAQSQCRATLEALSEIKNPRAPTFIRQQNNVAQQQQVNNGVAPSAREKDVTPPNEILENADGKRLDGRTQETAIGTDSILAPLGKGHRAEVRRGKAQ